MRELSKEELKNVQLEILKYIDKICKENNITYYIFFGTLIGAVRHKGFIPWDDDIDICIKRQEYKKLANIIKKENKYNFINFETNPEYYFTFARVSDPRTQLVLSNIRDIKNFGLFVDVFIIDNAPEEEEVEKWFNQYKSLRRKVELTIPTKYKNANLKCRLSALKNYSKRLKLKVKNFNRYMKELEECITKYNNRNTDKCIITATPYGTKTIFDKKDFDGVTKLEFEGTKVCAPIGYDNLLRKLYGNYMELPPESERKSSHHFKAYWKENE